MVLDSLIASGSITKKEENQDCVEHFEGDIFNFGIVADGLGTYSCAKLSSQKVVEFFIEKAKAYSNDPNFTNHKIKFKDVFSDVKNKLCEFATSYISENKIISENVFGTTAITLIETNEKFIFNYIGNGAIWHIRGNFFDFETPYLFPWSSINILNPHSVPQNGKEALYRLFTNSVTNGDCTPTTIELSKDEEFGDIVLLCTDGVSSADQIKAGKNTAGVWSKYEENMLLFYEHLKLLFINNKDISRDVLNTSLQNYLNNIKPTLEDDASIVVLITQKAREINSKYFKQVEEIKNT